MKKALLLHGWFGTPEDAWFPWLSKELTSLTYEVYAPQLEDKDKPTFRDWKKCALKALIPDEETIIIGHSLGGVLALKLAEEYKLFGLITVSGWDYWDLTPEHETFFESPIGHGKIITNVKNRAVVHSSNDPYVTKFIASEYAKRINASFTLLENKGHCASDDGCFEIPELLKIIKSFK